MMLPGQLQGSFYEVWRPVTVALHTIFAIVPLLVLAPNCETYATETTVVEIDRIEPVLTRLVDAALPPKIKPETIEAIVKEAVRGPIKANAPPVLQRNAFLERKSKQLHVKVAELTDEIDSWSKNTRDFQSRALASFFSRNYADALQLVASSDLPDMEKQIYIGKIELEQGNYAVAEETLLKALAFQGNNAVILNDLGVALLQQARYEKAERFLKKAFDVISKDKLVQDSSKNIILLNLANLYYALGQFSSAEPLYRQALAGAKENSIGSKPNLAIDISNLAEVYWRLGRYEDAEPRYKKAISITESAFGKDDPSLATMLNNLGVLYRSTGRYADAEALFNRARSIDEKTLGPSHPSVATDLNNLAELYSYQGRTDEAHALYSRALTITKEALGPTHPSVAAILGNLAQLSLSQGRYEEATILLRQVMSSDEQAYGPSHPSVATDFYNLAEVAYRQGEYRDAEYYLGQALAIQEKALGTEHPAVARTLSGLSSVYSILGRLTEAEKNLRKALSIYKKQLSPDIDSIADTYIFLTSVYRRDGGFDDANRIRYEARDILTGQIAKTPIASDRWLYLVDSLSRVNIDLGNYAAAESLLKVFLEKSEIRFGARSLKVARAMNILGVAYYEARAYSEAEPMFKTALGIALESLGRNHPDSIELDMAGRNHPDIRAMATNLYYALAEVGKVAEATKLKETYGLIIPEVCDSEFSKKYGGCV